MCFVRIMPWGQHSSVLIPVAPVIRDITFNVNVVMALNQTVGLFSFLCEELILNQFRDT